MHRKMLEACRSASLLIGGPSLTRLGVTSALREEGRTSVALAMATVQHEDFGRSVILVDMDYENPALAARHHVDSWPGLAEVVRGEVSIERVLQPLADGVRLVATGVVTDTVSRAVADIVKSGLMDEIEQHADVMIADLPPLLGGGPGRAAAEAFEHLLLVVRAGTTPVARVKQATADLHVAPNVLLNGAHTSLPGWIRRLLGR